MSKCCRHTRCCNYTYNNGCCNSSGADKVLNEVNPKLNKLIINDTQIMDDLNNVERIEIANAADIEEVKKLELTILRRLDIIEGKLDTIESNINKF